MQTVQAVTDLEDSNCKRMPESKAVSKSTAAGDLYLYSGLVHLHILHGTVEAPLCGSGISERLARHGYRIRPGSLHALLQDLETSGQLRSTEARNGEPRRVYKATPLGRKVLAAGKVKIQELFRELNAR
jgi:PadR family transcriptional regulator